jgi:PqqD family protein of HPr-rel-A system
MTDAARPVVRADVVVQEIDNELVVYDPIAEDLHALNAAATLVWHCCDGDGTVEEIAADIADVFGEPPDEVAALVRTVVGQLGERGLLEGARHDIDSTGTTVRDPLAEPPSP